MTYEEKRINLVKQLILERRIKSKEVEKAFLEVKREEFVPENIKNYAYIDSPLEIGQGQTISAPHMVAIMVEGLDIKKGQKILEIGAGSGYHAAVLSRIVKEVYTVEIIPPLGRAAEKRLKEAAYENIQVKVGDGYYGWEEYAPFDCIIVTAASDHIPPPLIKQLKRGGKMAIPVGGPFQVQNLMLVEKSGQGEIQTRNILPVRFVPFRRNWK